ncbi:AAA family ATPase [Streptomyces sp. SD15]
MNRITDSRGVTIGDNNTIYQHFHGEAYAPLAHKLISFTDLIFDKTTGFVGRRFALDAVDRFMAARPSGYFVIEGEPGVGKTSLLAHLVAERGYPHHFVVAALGVNRAEQFLENVSAQLIAAFRLNRPSFLPAEASRDGVFLAGLLADAARTGQRPVVVTVDALDEVSDIGDPRQNLLYLPPRLPDGVFVVVSTRPRDHADLRLHVESREFFLLDARSAANLADVTEYLEIFAARPAMRALLAAQGLPAAAFVETLLGKAEGNFMYLHHVLPAIEDGRLGANGLGDLPQGLQAYYESHWRLMRGADSELWFAYRQPVIVHLAAAREPVSTALLASWTGLSTGRVLDALRVWREFVHVEAGRYRIYHASFRDFLQAKDEIGEIDLADTNRRIADVLMRGLLFPGDGTP